MREFTFGSGVPRLEDAQLLRGRGRYTDDIRLPGETRLFVVRSPHAAARIRAIDIADARAMPDVVAVFTGADLAADGIGGLPSRARRQRPDGKPNFEPPYRALANGAVHMVGDPVVAVVAETLAAAKEAAERVAIDYEPLPAVTDTATAAASGATAVWTEASDNICFYQEVGDRAAVEAAFAR